MKLEEFLSNTADGVCAVDDGGRVIHWNRSAERILGHTARDVLGKPCCDIFAGADVAGNRLCFPGCHILNLVRLNEPVQHFDMATRTRGGRPVWLNVSILVVPPSGRVRGAVVHLFRDVTASRHREALLQDRRRLAGIGNSVPEEISALLTRREIETLRLMSTGIGTRAMANRLHVSPSTVRNHVQNILNKMGVHSRLEAVARAAEKGFVPAAAARD